MNTITKRTIAIAASVAAVMAVATPSFAQTRHHRAAQQPQMQEPYATEVQPGMGQFASPGYVHNPYECWSDEGNGRFSSCNNGSS